jgi:flagellar biogenesis protein FliO
MPRCIHSPLAAAAYVCALVPVTPLMAQKLGTADSSSSVSYGQIAGILIFLSLLIVMAWYLVRARGGALTLWPPASERRLSIVETVRPSPGTFLCLARLDNNEYLVAFTGQGIQLIDKRSVGEIS